MGGDEKFQNLNSLGNQRHSVLVMCPLGLSDEQPIARHPKLYHY